MADLIKILGQVDSSITTEADLYTVPDAKQTTVSTLTICNRTAGPIDFRISVSVAGAATGDKDYLYYDHVLAANDTMHVTIGMTLGAGDVVRIFDDTGSVSYNLFGVESN